METFIFITPQGIGDCIGQLVDDLYTLHYTQKLLKSTYQDIEFLTLEKNGKIIYNWDSELCVAIDQNNVSDLVDSLFKHENSEVFNFCVGVGGSLLESCKAANLATLNKSESVVYYTPTLDVDLLDAEYEDLFKDENGEDGKKGIQVPGLELDTDDKPQKTSPKQKTVEALMEIKKVAPQLTQLKQAAPDVFDAITKIVDAMIAMAEEKG